MRPVTRYAESRGGFVAYQTLGDGPVDLVIVAELVSHCEHRWEEPALTRAMERLADFSRVVLFDKRGTGLSDPVSLDRLPTLEERAEDLSGVLDAVGTDDELRVGGILRGWGRRHFFAATHPERVSSLVLYGAWPCFFADDSYPAGWDRQQFEPLVDAVLRGWGQGRLFTLVAPSTADDERLLSWWAGYERLAASPGVAATFLRIALDVDVRNLLPVITARRWSCTEPMTCFLRLHTAATSPPTFPTPTSSRCRAVIIRSSLATPSR
jgi:pimeloyl-ACP methyl ester carboxylesterase